MHYLSTIGAHRILHEPASFFHQRAVCTRQLPSFALGLLSRESIVFDCRRSWQRTEETLLELIKLIGVFEQKNSIKLWSRSGPAGSFSLRVTFRYFAAALHTLIFSCFFRINERMMWLCVDFVKFILINFPNVTSSFILFNSSFLAFL